MSVPRLGTYVYEIATGESFRVISDSATIWLRGDEGQLRQYSRKSFRMRREPNEMSDEGRENIRHGHAVRRDHTRQHLVAQYGEDVVRAAESTGMPVEFVARNWALGHKAEWDREGEA